MEEGKRKSKMGIYLLLALYILCSSTALLLIKAGANKASVLSFAGGVLEVRLGLLMLLGMTLYVFSFLLSMGILSRLELSFFYPVSAGSIYICVSLFSFFLLKESLTLAKLAGIVFILVGIIIVNL